MRSTLACAVLALAATSAAAHDESAHERSLHHTSLHQRWWWDHWFHFSPQPAPANPINANVSPSPPPASTSTSSVTKSSSITKSPSSTGKSASSSSTATSTTAPTSSSSALPSGTPVPGWNRTCVPFKKAKSPRGATPAANCVMQIPTRQIDDPQSGLLVNSTNGWGKGLIPEPLRGIFYMAGNPYAAECFSSGSAYWNATTNTTDVPQYQPRVWSTDPDSEVIRINTVNGSTLQNSCTVRKGFNGQPNANGYLDCSMWFYLKIDQTFQHKGEYTANQIGPHEWNRFSSVPGLPWLKYQYKLYRIVDSFGQRTPFWDSRYIANINKTMGSGDNQIQVHLKEWQELGGRVTV